MINYRFIIKKKLGEGRSKVFLCSDADNPEKEFAIKVLPVTKDIHEIKTFRDEFFTLQKLNHPNIITSHEEGIVVEDEVQWDIKKGSRFITLDYFPGSELLEYEKLNDEKNLKIILSQICSVLYYIHQSNYVYYDLKPENILVAEPGGDPVIKLIDMGFAHHSSSPERNLRRGTTEYIAPEILKNENHNHQVDLYSFGIMLYRIIYGKFPFNSKSQLDIYKEQIEREFEFPESNFSLQLIRIIKKFLAKNPLNRYNNSLQVLRDLDLNLDENIIKDFIPANVFVDREDATTQINKFLIDKESREVLLISGVEGSGKTSLIYKIYSAQERIIVLSNTGKSGLGFVHYLLKSVISSEYVHSFLSKDIIEQAESILTDNIDNLVTGLKSVITKISIGTEFILVIDDFNLLDDFVLDVCSEILPILQVNGIKIILTERSDHNSSANEILNKIVEINLTPFTDEGLNEYLNEAFASFFPKDQLKKLIVKYADLLPGSIVSFMRDLILLNIIRFTHDGPEIVVDEKTEKLLEGSQEEIFRLRLSLLTDDEIKLIQFISSFENTPDIKVISVLNDLPSEEINKMIKNLEEKNILQESKVVNANTFTSDSLKKYVYSIIKEKQGYHLKTARVLSEKFKSFNRPELAKQYELGKDFIATYNILSEEVSEADRLFAYSYKRNILNHLLKLPLPENYITELNYKLSLTLYKLNDTKSALRIIEDLLKKVNDEKLENDLLILKGSCLIELGEVEEGKNLLNDLVIKIKDEKRKQQLMVEIAYAEFDLNKYDIAKKICYEIINNMNSSPEDKAKCYNLLGLIDTYLDSNFDCALDNFQKALEMYESVNLILDVAKMEGNIGNTYNRKGDYINAEKHWNNSLRINISIGNLGHEARLLLSFGIFYYNKAYFEKAIDQYTRAYNIFMSLGNRNGQGLVLTNLGEAYLSSCEYQRAFESLTNAKGIFKQLLNVEEEAEVLFMLAKFFYLLGDSEQLKLLMNDFKSSIERNLLPDRLSNNYKFLELISSFHERKAEINSDIIKEGTDPFKEQNEGGFFAEGYLILCENLIKNGMYETAYYMLNDNKFENICNENFLYKAEKKYLESLLASLSNKNFNLPLPIKSLEEAHSLISNEQITELTWKVLYFLGEHYFDRGNLSKAGDYLKYSKEVINFIAQNIQDENMRISYLSKPERSSILRKIEIMENKF